MVTNYEVITARRIADLQDRVQERINVGWQPIGGIAMLHEDEAGEEKPHMVFAQAIVSEKASSKNG